MPFIQLKVFHYIFQTGHVDVAHDKITALAKFHEATHSFRFKICGMAEGFLFNVLGSIN